MTRILLADANIEVRTALRLVIEQQDGSRIIGEAFDALNLFSEAALNCPDIVLLDADLTGLQMHRSSVNSRLAEVIATLHKLCPAIRVIALSSQPTAEKLCFSAKADAFICKSDPPEVLLALLDHILQAKDPEC